MKKLLLVLLGLLIAATLAIILLTSIFGPNDQGQYGLTNRQKANATQIALSAFPLGYYTSNASATYSVGNVERPGPGYYTYSNTSNSLVVVPISFKLANAVQNFSVTVDMNSSRVVSVYRNDTSTGISYRQQMDAVNATINDGSVKGWIDGIVSNTAVYPSGYAITGVHKSSFADYGFIDRSGLYEDVPIEGSSGIAPANQYMLATVNLDRQKVMIKKQWTGEALMGYSIEATIPPGYSYYQKFSSSVNYSIYTNGTPAYGDLSRGSIRVTIQPDIAQVRPMFIDTDNFARLWNGTAPEELKNMTFTYTGSDWSAWITEKAPFYMVLTNDDTTKDAYVTIRTESLMH